MSLANILLGIAVIVGGLSFVYFARLMQRMPTQRALLTGSKPGKYVNFIVVIPAALTLVFGSFPIRVVAAACLLLAILGLAVYQHRWLRAHGAEPAFLRQLLVSSLGFGLAVTSFAGSMVLGA
jgi:hypothetical protein